MHTTFGSLAVHYSILLTLGLALLSSARLLTRGLKFIQLAKRLSDQLHFEQNRIENDDVLSLRLESNTTRLFYLYKRILKSNVHFLSNSDNGPEIVYNIYHLFNLTRKQLSKSSNPRYISPFFKTWNIPTGIAVSLIRPGNDERQTAEQKPVHVGCKDKNSDSWSIDV